MWFRKKELADLAVAHPDEDETNCLFVSSKGIMKLCDIHQPLPNDAAKKWPIKILKNHKPGGTIYVHASALKHFAKWALPKLKTPFVLVSGDSVIEINPDVVGHKTFQNIVSHPELKNWNTQNAASTHKKIDKIPLGIDFHSISQNKRNDWSESKTPVEQELEIFDVRRQSIKIAERQLKAHCTWHFMPENGDREEVLKILPPEACVYEAHTMPRTDMWHRNAAYFFTISPRGRGMDCHRTWEAILIGSTPVIPDLPINSLFSRLPVVIVKDWRKVTSEFLKLERERILSETFDFAPVLLETWRRQLRDITPLPELRMSYQEFMDLDREEMRGYCQMP